MSKSYRDAILDMRQRIQSKSAWLDTELTEVLNDLEEKYRRENTSILGGSVEPLRY